MAPASEIGPGLMTDPVHQRTGQTDDVADQRTLERRAQDLSERLQLALDAGQLGTWVWDKSAGTIEWDERLQILFGIEPGTFDGRFETYAGLLHPDDAGAVLERVEQAMLTKSRYVVEHRVVWPDGSLHWLEGAGQVTLDASGEVTGTIGCVAEVTARVEGEIQRQQFTLEALVAAEDERVSRERLEFLARITEAVNLAADVPTMMRSVVSAAVPRLGEWCSIFVLPDDGSLYPDVEIAHVDPEMVDYALALRERFPYDPTSEWGIPEVIRSGRTLFVPEIDTTVLDEAGLDEEARAIVDRLALRSSITVPLVSRGRVLGAMQFVMSESSRRYTHDDITLGRAVGSRIASSLENRRLAERQRVIASTLQGSLLPNELPPIPGVEVAVRYWATGEGTEVGGDFYDLFPIDDSTWGVVVGDVCGTGPAAAAITGLARHTVASAAWHGDDPSETLAHLNSTMRRRHTDVFCTLAFGHLTVEPQRLDVALAIGGHPLPIVADGIGGAEPVGLPGTLMGVFDDVHVTTVPVTVGPGEAMVLYTDGVTDVPPPHELDARDFATIVGEEAALADSAEGLADRLHDRLASILEVDQRSDDIALMILRVPPAG